MKTILYATLLTGLLFGETDPTWNYTPMHTVGVFEGLQLTVWRPVSDVFTLTVTAAVDGGEVHKSMTIRLKYRTHNDGNVDRSVGFAEFPMQIGGLDDFDIKMAKMVNGSYCSDFAATKDKPILPAINYRMSPVIRALHPM